MHQPGQYMLTGMILHKAESSLPVDLKEHMIAGKEKLAIVFRAADSMSDHSVFNLYIRYSQHSGSMTTVVSGAADPADVGGLAPAFREKNRLVQDQLQAAAGFRVLFSRQFPYRENRRLTPCQICVIFVKSLCGVHVKCSFSLLFPLPS